MNIILRNIIAASLLLTATAASAQHQTQNIEDWMYSNISRVIDAKVEVQKSLGQERDVLTEGTPLKWRCDIYTFTLPKRQRALLEEMKKAFEANGRENPNCYGVNSLSDGADGNGSDMRNLMIGEDPSRYVTIGKDYDNYLNINILDAADSTKTHRYAYALEWRNGGKGTTDVRYIVTYAKIPSATTSISVFDLGRARVNPHDRITVEGPFRFQWQGRDYPTEKIDSIFRNKRQDSKQEYERLDSIFRKSKAEVDRIRKAFVKGNSIVVWADTLDHDTDPVTDVILRLQEGQDITAADLLCNDNILLIFSQLKQQYLAGQNREFNAISIYNLCRQANIYGFFNDKYSKEELELLKREVTELIAKAEETSEKVYFGLALSQLMKIE
ncbi:MAG: hypothetical protein IKO12_08950 [Bacteroidaceae bacterium]|nr:hypothetical protein [Bacteroidaceae bacterium]